MRARLAAGRLFSNDLVGLVVDVPRSDGSKTRGQLTGFIAAAVSLADADFKQPVNLATARGRGSRVSHWGVEAEWETAVEAGDEKRGQRSSPPGGGGGGGQRSSPPGGGGGGQRSSLREAAEAASEAALREAAEASKRRAQTEAVRES